MGDLIGQQLEGTLYYAGNPAFAAVADLAVPDRVKDAVFADLCRVNALYMIARAGSGHIGSSFSCLDVVSHVLRRVLPGCEAAGEQPGLYFSSKGHDSPGLYAALIATGALPESSIHGLRKLGGLPGHPDVETPGIVTNTGSLGMGISKAKGMIAAHRARSERRRVVVLTGDGELQEGQIWESLAGAVHAQMDELLVIVDHNKLQSDTFVSATSDLGDLVAKFSAFGFRVAEVDGHDHAALAHTTQEMLAVRGLPQVIIAHTIKGCGVSFMEHTVLDGEAPRYRYHSGAPDADSYQKAVTELAARIETRLGGQPLPALHPVEATAKAAQTLAKDALIPAYADALAQAGQTHPELAVLDADLAYDIGLSPFRERFPERFFECGIAEMDMVSMAGGMALRGLRPICNSFACFLTARPNEQIYNNASEHTNVIYMGALAGLLPAGPGHSHQGLRDISALGGTPGMTCIQPGDPQEVALALDYALAKADGPVYLRMCSIPVARPYDIPKDRTQLVRGQGSRIRAGHDGVIVAHGPVMLAQAYAAAERLALSGDVDLAVYNLPFLNVIDRDWLGAIVGKRPYLFTIDDHFLDGGQGQRVAALVPELGLPAKVLRFGVEGWPACGEPDEVLAYHGLDAASVASRIRAFVGEHRAQARPPARAVTQA